MPDTFLAGDFVRKRRRFGRRVGFPRVTLTVEAVSNDGRTLYFVFPRLNRWVPKKVHAAPTRKYERVCRGL